jgi:hypothetical protein
MMGNLKVCQFPERDLSDIPSTLRRIADGIEAGEYGDAHNLVWVCDQGDVVISVGLCGKSPEPASTGHFLLALGMRKLENM